MRATIENKLARLELIAAVTAALADRAHRVRGHLGVIQNTMFVLEKRMAPDSTEPMAAARRAVDGIGLALDEEPGRQDGPEESADGTIDDAVRLAVAECRGGAPEALTVSLAPATVSMGVLPLALAVRAALENAIQAGGTRTVITVVGTPHDGGYLVTVTDQAGGLSGMDAAGAVRPFTSTKPGRAGLGLSTARWLMREAGGGLTLVPAPGGLAVELFIASNEENHGDDPR